MNKLRHIQEFLADIEVFLRDNLANEKLSAAAQIKRRHLLDRYYALQLQANDQRNPLGSTVISKNSTSQAKNLTQDTADDLSKDSEQNLYEEPVIYDSNQDNHTENGHVEPNSCISEDGSDTEYESYDEDEEGVAVAKPDIPLPQKKCKKELDLSRLPNVIHTGELFQKGLLSWLKRFCVISDGRLLCFRSQKVCKPILTVALLGYDAVHMVKDGKYGQVIRLSYPGCETHWFYTDSKESASKWIVHLCQAGCVKELNEKTDTVAQETGRTEADTVSQNSASYPDGLPNSQACQSGGSSEGGSGDGVAQSHPSGNAAISELERKQSTIDKRKKIKIGESLQTLLGTFSKKKDDKIKRALSEIVGIDIETTHAAGYVNICSDLAEANKWVKRFCVVKYGRLDCYKDPLDEYIEFSFPLSGAQIQEADKQQKRIKLTLDQKDVFIETFNVNDYGKWLCTIFRESGGGGTQREQVDGSESEGIYNEVYNWQVYNTEDVPSFAVPPPLPKARPPSKIQPTQPTDVYQDIEFADQADAENIFTNALVDKNDSLGLEEALNSAFDNIRDGLNKRSQSPKGRTTNQSSELKAAVKRKSPITVNNIPPSTVTNVPPSTGNVVPPSSGNVADQKNGVVKCHTGPAIEEDKELLEATQNPILIELRKGKSLIGSGSLTKFNVQTQLQDLRKVYEDIKKKRATVRSSLQTVRSSLEKVRLETELQLLDKQIEETDRDIAKLSLLAQETESSSFGNRVLRSSSASRSDNGIRSYASSPTFIHFSRNSSLKEAKTSQALFGSPSKPNLVSSSPEQIRRLTSMDKRSSFSGNVAIRSSFASSTLGSETVLSTRSSFDGSKITKKLTDGRTQSISTSNISKVSSYTTRPGDNTKAKLDSNGSSVTSLSARATSRLSVVGNPSGNGSILPGPEGSATSATRKAVQEKLKLWESRSENTCSSLN